MRIDILTLFPDTMRAMLGESILGRAQARGLLDIRCHQIRDYTENRQKQVDDYPYGGGWGQVMMAQPLKSCLDAALADSAVPAPRRRVIYLSPQGPTFTQAKARQLKADYDQLVLVCGHYEGVDERFIEACVDEELSIGDFVLTGGELGAMVVTDCVCRMVPGVLSDTECYTGESHWAGRLEYPQYTRPETWEGRTVPEVLRGGNHAEIEAWRTRQSLERTLLKRPDLFRETPPTPDEQRLLDKIRRDRSRPQLTEPPVCRAAAEDDLPAILAIAQQARNYLRRHRVDQWQGEYPNADTFRADIAAGTCHVLTYQGAVSAARRSPPMTRSRTGAGARTVTMPPCCTAMPLRPIGAARAWPTISCRRRSSSRVRAGRTPSASTRTGTTARRKSSSSATATASAATSCVMSRGTIRAVRRLRSC